MRGEPGGEISFLRWEVSQLAGMVLGRRQAKAHLLSRVSAKSWTALATQQSCLHLPVCASTGLMTAEEAL